MMPWLKEYSNSGCLPRLQENYADEQYPWCGKDRIEVIKTGMEVHLIHRNATYNCCPDDIRVSMSVDGNVIKVTEEEIGGLCDCMCCYDIKSVIVNLSPGIYEIEYCWHDYETGEECYREEIILP